ncbi:MAG: hypothetical protein CL946_05535 [Ectothiorhodospiraceae bacterium]|nr:hypothetical protein [Ectothiorhodospiraceae bacterium]
MNTPAQYLRNIIIFAILGTFAVQGLNAQENPFESVPQFVKERKSFKRYEWFYRQRTNPDGELPVATYLQERNTEMERDRVRKQSQYMQGPAPAASVTWETIGPNSVTDMWPSHWGDVSGRVRAVAVHPTNANTAYIGAAAGGIWKTTNGGSSWSDIGSGLSSITFGAIAVSPADPNIVFAGTGEVMYLFNSVTYDGQGLFKSTNGGTSWTHITNGFGNQTHFSDIEVSPHNANIVLASLGSGYSHLGSLSNEGVWRSTDGGTTWTETLTSGDAFDVCFDPSSSTKAYAALGGGSSSAGFYISTNAGASWTKSNSGLPSTSNIQRIQISQSQSSPAVFYALIYNSSGTVLYKSTDGGASWSQIAAGTKLGGTYDGTNWNDQGFYDLCIAVHPTNPNRVIVGNVELHLSTNGSSFSPLRYGGGTNAWSSVAHVDYHKVVFAPSNPNIVYLGCDGGVFKSTDAGSNWNSANNNISTLQFYRIASHPTDADKIMGGAQDNGNFRKSSSGATSWSFVSTGDGMECVYDHSNPNIVYYSTQNGRIYKSTNGGSSGSTVWNSAATWVTPIVMHPTNSSVLYTANTNFIKTTNGGNSWNAIATGVAPRNINCIAQSPVNPDNMMISAGDSYYNNPNVYASTNEGGNWTEITSNIPGSDRYITRLVADPNNASTFYLVRSGFSSGNKIYKTTNLGTSWTNVSGDLPNVPHNDFFVDPEEPTHFYAANDFGVYRSTDAGANWTRQGNGMPFVPVMDFDYVEIGSDRLLRAGTHGRSAFEANIGSVPCASPSVTLDPSDATVCNGSGVTFVSKASGTDPVSVSWEESADNITYSAISGATDTSYSFTAATAKDGYYYRAVFTNACGSATSAAAQLTVTDDPVISQNPSSQSACTGTFVTFTANATGTPAPTLQWQYSENGTTYSDIPGATSTSYSFTASQADHGNRYRMRAANSCGTVTSTSAVLSVNSAPLVTSHPTNRNICAGSSVIFSASASGNPTPTIQWEVSTDGVSFSAIPGATSSTYQFTAGAGDDSKQYRAVFTNTCGSATSNIATLTVGTAASITLQPADVTLCDAGTARFVAKAAGTPTPTVQWQYSTDGFTYVDIPGETDTVYTFAATPAQNAYAYRASFTGGCGSLDSDPAILTVNESPGITLEPADQTLCDGQVVTFTSAATGTATLSAQWQDSPDGITFTDIPGATATSYSFTVDPSKDGYHYRVGYANMCGSATSAAAALTVTPTVTVTKHPADVTACDGASITLTARAAGDPAIQWQNSADGNVFVDIPGATDSTYTYTASSGTKTEYFRANFAAACGSVSSDPAVVTVNTPVTITSNPANQVACDGAIATFMAGADGDPAPTVQWEESADGLTFTPLTGETGTGLTFNVDAAKDGYFYRAVFTNTCGSMTTSMAQLTVNAGITIDAGADESLCLGGDVQLEAVVTGGTTPYIYSWTPSEGLSGDSVANPVASPSATTTYTVTVMDGSGCQATDQITITVYPTPLADAGSDEALCSGGAVTLGNPPVGGTPPYAYSWSPSAGLDAVDVQQPLAAPDVTTTYTLTVTDANGCSSSDDVTVTIFPNPVADAGTDTTICRGTAITIGSAATNGTAPFTYAWSPATGLSDPNIATPLASPVVTRTYTLHVTDANGCSTVDSIRLTVNEAPIAYAGEDASFCAGGSTQLGAVASGGTPPYSYIWTPTRGLDDPNIAQPVASPTRTTTYTLTVVDATGCTASDNVTVLIEAAPIAFAGADVTICGGEDIVLGNIASGGTGPYTYAWSPQTALSDPAVAKPIASPMTTTTYEVRVTDAKGCSSVDSVTVSVRPTPVADAGLDATLCNGNRIQLGNPATGGTAPYLYTWSPIEGLSAPNIAQPLASPEHSTTYTLTVTDANGCVSTDQVIVTVKDLPQPFVLSDKPLGVCRGEKVTLSVNNKYDSYLWSTGDTGASIQVSTAGNYYVIVSNSGNCKDTSAPVTVKIYDPPTPVVHGPGYVCPDTQATYYVSGEDGVSYSWSIVGGVALSDLNGESVRVQWTDIGKGSLTVHAVHDISGCTSDEVFYVDVSPTFAPVITSDINPVVCYGEQVVLDAGTGYESYEWSTGATTQKLVVKAKGDYWVKVTLESGCSGVSEPFHVEVYPQLTPVITYQGSLDLCEGESVELDAGTGYTRYEWNTGAKTQKIVVSDPGTYQVKVFDAKGCSAVSRAVKVQKYTVPQAEIKGDWLACQRNRFEYYVDDVPGYKYSWTAVGGRIVSGEGTSKVAVYWDSPGTATIAVEIFSEAKCSAFLSHNITVRPTEIPQVTASGPTEFCKGGGVVLTAEDGFETYRWSTGEEGRKIEVTKAGKYWVYVTDANGCKTNSEPIEVIVYPVPNVSIEGITRFRPTVEQTFKVPHLAGNIYEWDAGEGVITSGQGSPTITARWDITIKDTLKVYITNVHGCQKMIWHIVEVTPDYFPEIEVLGNTTICDGSAVELQGPPEGVAFRWSTGESTKRITVREPGTYFVTITDKHGIDWDSRPVMIFVLPKPVPELNYYGSAHICSGDQLLVDAGEGYQKYEWSHGPSTRKVYISEPGIYFVRVTDKYGCVGESELLQVTSGKKPPKPHISQRGKVLTATEGPRYAWYYEGVPVPGAYKRQIVTEKQGAYTVSITSDDGCTSMSDPYDFRLVKTNVQIPLDVEADAGEPVTIPIGIKAAPGMAKVTKSGVSLTLRFNKEVLVPHNVSYRDSAEYRYATFTGHIPTVLTKGGEQYLLPADSLVDLAALNCTAMLSTFEGTELHVESIEFDDPTVHADITDGVFTLGICRQGAPRFVSTAGRIELQQNTPNPFHKFTTIKFSTVERGYTQLYVLDMTGRRIRTLVDGYIEPGEYEHFLDLRQMPSGTYIYVLQTPTLFRQRLMNLVK